MSRSAFYVVGGLLLALSTGCAHGPANGIPATPAVLQPGRALTPRAGTPARAPKFLMPTPDFYDSGYTPSVSFLKPGKLVEMHVSSTGYLWYRIGFVDRATVSWGKSHDIDSGDVPAVAGDGNDGVFEVHRHSSRNDTLYYGTGKALNNNTIEWINTNKYSNGNDPMVAFSGRNVILESHVDSNGLGSWGVATIASGGEVKWGTRGTFTGGYQPSVAANSSGKAVEVERRQQDVHGSYFLYYRVGQIDAANRTVKWLNRQELPLGATEETGKSTAVALDDAGNVIVLYACRKYDGVFAFAYGWCSITGKLESNNLVNWVNIGELSPPMNYFIETHGLSSPGVATTDGVAVGVAQQGSKGLYFGTTFLTDRSNWMGDRLNTTLKDKTLRQIVLPGSHDAGMYKGNADFLGLAQNQDFYNQLGGGQRYFDLRPDAGLNVYHGPVKGPSVQVILNDVKRYMDEGHREVVILKFSHFDFEPSITAGTPYAKLAEMVSTTLSKYLYDNTTGKRLADIPLSTLIPAGHGIVIPVMDLPGSFATAGHAGLYTYRDWDSEVKTGTEFTVYDQYSNTSVLSWMQNDQLQKLRTFNGKMKTLPGPCDLFLLSWTITPVLAIRASAAEANATLAPEMSHVRRNGYGFIPNILYVDFYSWADAADVAIAANATL